MNSSAAARRALDLAIAQLLRPLFRLLLRHAVSFRAFEDLAKRTYVEVAWKEFGIPGKKPSTSRVAVLSGLTRKEVQRLLDGDTLAADDDLADRYNRAARVLTGWVRDTDFHDATGAPRVLAPDGDASFATLVRRYSGDMPARAVLDELLRVGAVCTTGDGRLQLLTHAYVPAHSPADKLAILGSDVADLVTTIEHNLQHGSAAPRFQRKVMYDAIPISAVADFQKLSAAQSQALLEQLDSWLAQHDLDAHPQAGSPQRVRVGVGVYYFEEDLGPYVVEGEKP
ncbi:DUF6502 family protein [Ideonella sp. BN130291]|uniref:DUF6502 family protein n=1 Tax=Ideonella sp. BN130291 TaxID=3112940 RepID=UPI002E25BD01|nr:DUF6502 family protein [Ideonella sp. BN130291]